jgi:hypothetical protein
MLVAHSVGYNQINLNISSLNFQAQCVKTMENMHTKMLKSYPGNKQYGTIFKSFAQSWSNCDPKLE